MDNIYLADAIRAVQSAYIDSTEDNTMCTGVNGLLDHEKGIIDAFNHCLSHTRNNLTSKYGIILSNNYCIRNRLTVNSFALYGVGCNSVRLRKYNSDKVYISSYGDILYNGDTLQLSVISVQNIDENGCSVTIIPDRVYDQLQLYRYGICSQISTFNLAMQCFADFFEKAESEILTINTIFNEYVEAVADEDVITINDPYSSGYQMAMEYISAN